MGGYSAVATVVSNIAGRFTTTAQLDKLKAFNIKHKSKLGSSISTLENAEKTVQFNLDWSQKNLPAIRDFLKNYSKNGSAMNKISLLTLVLMLLLGKIFY